MAQFILSQFPLLSFFSVATAAQKKNALVTEKS